MPSPCGNEECCVSTGIHEGLTFGSGEVDPHGFWERPCSPCARAAERRDGVAVGTYWPFADFLLDQIREDAAKAGAAEENRKLREAIRDAGFAVMQTSGKWSIHCVTEKARRAEEVEDRLISSNLDLELQVQELKAEVNRLSEEIEAVVRHIPPAYQVRVHEGGGPENLCASLAVSVAKLAAAVRTQN